MLERVANGRWGIRGGAMAEALMRFAWFKECFGSGLELDQIGSGGEFLALRQPFILGGLPDKMRLHEWMHGRGWPPWSPPTDLAMIHHQTWWPGDFIAPVAETDPILRPIDFIVARIAK